MCVVRWHCSHKHNIMIHSLAVTSNTYSTHNVSTLIPEHTPFFPQKYPSYPKTTISVYQQLISKVCLCWIPAHSPQSKTKTSRPLKLIQQVTNRFPLVSVYCLDPEPQHWWMSILTRAGVSSNLTASAPQEVSWRPLHVSLTTCVVFLRKVPPCDRSASCRRSSMAECTVAPLGSCCTAEWEKKKKRRWLTETPGSRESRRDKVVLHCWCSLEADDCLSPSLPVLPLHMEASRSTVSPWNACLQAQHGPLWWRCTCCQICEVGCLHRKAATEEKENSIYTITLWALTDKWSE